LRGIVVTYMRKIVPLRLHTAAAERNGQGIHAL